MKNLIPFIAVFAVATSCNFYEVEPRYDDRDRFTGYYDVEEYSQTYNDITRYEIRISHSRYDREVYIDNFYAADIRIHATVSFNVLRIPFQVVDGYEVDGTGTLIDGELTLNYRVKDLYNYTAADYCETVAWR